MSDSFAAPWTVARQAPLSMGFPREEYWSGLPFPSAGDLPDPGIEPASPSLASGFLYHRATWKAPACVYVYMHKHTGRYNFCFIPLSLELSALFVCCGMYVYYVEDLSFTLACLPLDPLSVPGRICT